VYKRKRDDAKSNQGKIHNSPQFSPSGEKKYLAICIYSSDSVTIQEQGDRGTFLESLPPKEPPTNILQEKGK